MTLREEFADLWRATRAKADAGRLTRAAVLEHIAEERRLLGARANLEPILHWAIEFGAVRSAEEANQLAREATARLLSGTWDESLHPRGGKGSHEGGKFVSKGGATTPAQGSGGPAQGSATKAPAQRGGAPAAATAATAAAQAGAQAAQASQGPKKDRSYYRALAAGIEAQAKAQAEAQGLKPLADTPPPGLVDAGADDGDAAYTQKKYLVGDVLHKMDTPPTPEQLARAQERAKLHQEIGRKLFAGKPRNLAKPVAFITTGGPASGKTTGLRTMIDDKEREANFVTINADDVKAELPEYQEGVGARWKGAANLVHEESSVVAKALQRAAVTMRMNVVIDQVGANPEKTLKLAQQLRDKGYVVKGVGMTLPLEEGLNRAITRAYKEGRYVPPTLLTETYPKINANVAKVMNHPVWHESKVVDNSVRGGRLVLERDESGTTRVHDLEFVNRLSTGGES